MKKIAVLGSTGSIGTQTLEIVRQNRDLDVVALAAGSSVEKMEQQIREFSPRIAALRDTLLCLWQKRREYPFFPWTANTALFSSL